MKLNHIEVFKYVVFIVLFYFLLVPSIFHFLGLLEQSKYFGELAKSNTSIFFFIFLSNFILFLGFAFAITKSLDISNNQNWFNFKYVSFKRKLIALVYFCLVYLVWSSLENFSLDRSEVKEEVTFLSSTFLIFTLTASSYLMMKEKNFLIILPMSFFILVLAFSFSERELLLYAGLPIFIRFSVNYGRPMFFLLGLLGMLSILLFKVVSTEARNNFEFTDNSIERISWYLTNLANDALVKYELENAYLLGDSPQYKKLTYLAPFQIFRLIDETHTSNGRIATSYYTNGFMGTGFSALLESWQNFGYLGPFVSPIFLFILLVFTFRFGGTVLLIPLLVFLVKFLRGELWTAYMIYITFPFIFLILKRLFVSRSLFLRKYELA